MYNGFDVSESTVSPSQDVPEQTQRVMGQFRLSGNCHEGQTTASEMTPDLLVQNLTEET